ncbi:tyrosine-type recombinase/integrase [Roseicitreum antarcticum]|uniref:Site-specific recombinase XerD n=3 Tax=Roseicitreum antarcticum TaxID=564137 RepID=A0A1H3FWC1_9RHOB|nr:tyrosine-type recombinase/integrase [Roseicitreum antarcticum]SDX95403.1 Site-specific recombinase XerD [Roseicitreum antarcticum]
MNVIKRQAPAPRTMDAGELTPWVNQFAEELTLLRYSPLTIQGYTDCARHFAAWLAIEKVELGFIDHDILGRFAKHRCRCGGTRRAVPCSTGYLNRVHRFISFLARRGIIAPLAEAVANSVDPLVGDFQEWLLRHRGIREQTAVRHGRMVMRLLPSLGSDPHAYGPAGIRMAILNEAQHCSVVYTKTMMTALRGYLRFLAASDRCRPGLEHAVPRIPQWRLSSLPRYLSPDQVERVVASCDLQTRRGIRDRAILLLLARLGLRAGDISEMRLQHIDWRSGTLRVKGKGRSETLLPLPQDAGDAVLGYLNDARPAVDDDRMFLTVTAPFRPFHGSPSISQIVSHALTRSGIEDPPSRGANLLRHSAATHLLRSGATLQSIGAVLRHKSVETTVLYAKVDVIMLERIAQPWPGEVSC